MVSLFRDKMPRIGFRAQLTNPEVNIDVEEFRRKAQYFKFAQVSTGLDFKKQAEREKGSFIES